MMVILGRCTLGGEDGTMFLQELGRGAIGF